MAMNEKLVMPLGFTVLNPGNLAGAANLQNERLGRVATTANFALDLGSVQSVDTFAFLATNAPVGALCRVRGYANAADAIANANTQIADSGTRTFWASPEAGKRLHRQGVIMFDQPAAARYWLVEVSVTISIGRFIIGKSFTAADTMDVGYSFKVYDYGTADTSPTGLDNPTLRGKALEYSWVWSWMSEQEARGALLDLLALAGNTRDVLCILNPDAPDLHNVIGYGKLVEEVEGTNIAGGNGIPNAYEARFRLRSRLLLNL